MLLVFRIVFRADTKSCPVRYIVNNYPICESPLYRDRRGFRYVTEIALPFLCVNRSVIWYSFPTGAKPIWYIGNIAQRNKLHAINYLPQSTFTAMIRFSARGAYLLWYLKGRHLFGTGRSFLFLRNNRMLKKTKLIIISKGSITETVTVTNIRRMFS